MLSSYPFGHFGFGFGFGFGGGFGFDVGSDVGFIVLGAGVDAKKEQSY